MLSFRFLFLFCVAICIVNAKPIDDIEGAGIMMIRKTIVSSELPNNKTVIFVTVQQKRMEVEVLPPPNDEVEQKDNEDTIDRDTLGPNMQFGWQDLTRYNERNGGYAASAN